MKTRHYEEEHGKTTKLFFSTRIERQDLPPETEFTNARNFANLIAPVQLILGLLRREAYLSFPKQIFRMSASFYTTR